MQALPRWAEGEAGGANASVVIMGQQMDEAKAFIDTLPAEGACVVAITNDRARWLANGIKERCGNEYAQRCRVIGINRLGSVGKLVGEQRRVVLHSSFTDYATAPVLDKVRVLAGGCNARHPPLVR